MRKVFSLPSLFALLLASAPFRASGQTITEFALPTGTPVTFLDSQVFAYARSITAGPDGNLWLTDLSRRSIIRMTPSGDVAEFKVLALGITVGPDGNLWFTESNNYISGPNGQLPFKVAIGKLTPGGEMTEYPIPSNAGAASIIVGPDRNLWYAWYAMGRATLQGILSGITTSPAISRPISITLGPDGNVWFTGPWGDASETYVGKITPAGAVTTYPLPTPHAYPVDIVAGPDGNLWFTERNANKIGRITPQGVITEFPVPTSNAQPTAICVGPDGNIWFTESNAAKVGRLALSGPAAGKITLTVPAAASSAGANGTFFHTDLWLMNRSFTSPVVATLTYRCAPGLACGNAVQFVTLLPRQSLMLTDVIGQTFSAPSTSGAIEVSWPTTSGPVSASSQVTTPLPPAPTFGTLIPALPLSSAKMHAVFIGVASGGGATSGSRSNAGAYNPQPVPVDVTFGLFKGDGTSLGTYTKTYQPNEALQLFPNIFDLVGAGSTVTKDAYLAVTATAPVFPYVTVIDNVSGDSSFLSASDDETAP